MLANFKLQRCPVCGKKPTVWLERTNGFGGWCMIYCKPLFGKTHLKTAEHGKASIDRAWLYTQEQWNTLCQEYK